jgi:hypothetical protein
MARPLAATLALLLVLTATPRARQAPSTTALLDRYLAGDFDAVTASLSALESFDTTLAELQRDGAAWIDAQGPVQRARRELAAANFALEAARFGAPKAWKDDPRALGIPSLGIGRIEWKAPPLLIEWACERLRHRTTTPSESERLWFLASIAVAEYAEDPEFLVGVNFRLKTDVIQHINHAQSRFPKDTRINFAVGVGQEWHNAVTANRVLQGFQDDVDVGAEARLRLGVLAWRNHEFPRAQSMLHGMGTRTHDPWIVYLARYFEARILMDRNSLPQAELLFRRALDATPGAQSATIALAALLMRAGRTAEASELTEAMLAARPAAVDPWRVYARADDRFWPFLISRLRQEILP